MSAEKPPERREYSGMLLITALQTSQMLRMETGLELELELDMGVKTAARTWSKKTMLSRYA